MIYIKIAESNKCVGTQSLYITFDFSFSILEKIKNLPIRFYDNETKSWEVPIILLDQVKKNFEQFDYKIYGKIQELEEIKYNYKFKTNPLKHQLDAIQYGLNHAKFLLGDEMGLGKTKEVLDLACIRKTRDEVKRVLVICGINTLKFNWLSEIEKHTDERGWILGSRKTKNGKIRVGSNLDKLEDLRNLDEDIMFMITNIESFRNPDFTFEVEKLCAKNKIDMIIFDEAHTMRNQNAQQTKGVLRIQAKYMVAMSGTFILNRPLDLFSPLKWTGYYKESYYRFKNNFTITDNWGNVCGTRNMSLLRKLVSSYMLRRLKSEVLDLPEKSYVEEKLEMTAKQAIIYEEVMDELRANIDKIRLSSNPLTEILRARQATGYTGLLSTTIRESAKLDRLVELVDEISNNGYKCLVYSNWSMIIEEAKNRLQEFNPAIITGDYKDYDIELQKKKFKEDSTCKVACGTIGKMGTGLTLNEANYVIFLDSPWTKGVKEQAIDRCHRIGQKNNITVITLVCKDTVDEKIEYIVEQKGQTADLLIDGKAANNSMLAEWLLYD